MASVFRIAALGAAIVLVACGSEDPEPRGGVPGLRDDGPATGAPAATEPAPPASSGAPAAAKTSEGCGLPAVQSGFADGLTLDVDGRARTYGLFVPISYDPKRAYPIVFAFHGDGGSGSGIRRTMKLEDQAHDEAIFVYPDGVSKTWELDEGADSNKDVRLVVALVDALAKTYCVDPDRRFAAGFSRGAYFANQLACRSPRPFRAVATHGGGGPYGLDGEYRDDGTFACTAPVPAALVVHGERDSLGDTGKESRDFYRARNACKASAHEWAPSPCVGFDGCSAGKPVHFCLVPGLGHQFWSNGAAATWSFFASQ